MEAASPFSLHTVHVCSGFIVSGLLISIMEQFGAMLKIMALVLLMQDWIGK